MNAATPFGVYKSTRVFATVTFFDGKALWRFTLIYFSKTRCGDVMPPVPCF
jgi:hypothetical protein